MSWDNISCGGMASNFTPPQLRVSALAGPAYGPRARYDVQGFNCWFASSSKYTGTHAPVGRFRGDLKCLKGKATTSGRVKRASLGGIKNQSPGR